MHATLASLFSDFGPLWSLNNKRPNLYNKVKIFFYIIFLLKQLHSRAVREEVLMEDQEVKLTNKYMKKANTHWHSSVNDFKCSLMRKLCNTLVTCCTLLFRMLQQLKDSSGL